jgi:hypothetical protein
VCGEQDLTEQVIIEDRAMHAEKYINELLPIALKSGNRILEDSWTYQQDGTKPHIH